MLLARNKIKYLNSLKIKKYRNLHNLYILEGEKIVSDILSDGVTPIQLLIATPDWLKNCSVNLNGRTNEILEADMTDLQRISTMETPPRVMAVMDMQEPVLNYAELSQTWSIALDTIQDPGNLGTIIRTADWFGIRHIICNAACADCFNPKVVQASMGAILRVHVYYADLPEVLKKLQDNPDFPMYGTFMEGLPVYDMPAAEKGTILFGNESRGISPELFSYIRTRITIPASNRESAHVESLNVASAVAVVCSAISRR
jgi:RNA methyltransferase, TrmH family